MNKKAQVFAIVNRKGGVGKTTTAVTLAHGLAQLTEGEGHVLLVDLDPQGNVAHSLGLDPNGRDIARVLTGDLRAEDAIVHADRSHEENGPSRPNLWVLPASDALADAKLQLVATAAMSTVLDQFGGSGKRLVPTNQLLQTHLSNALTTFDYIVLDCPPSLDMLGTAIYHFADEAIVPVKVDYLGVGGAARHTKNIIDAQARGIDIRVKFIVPTFVRAREILARQMLTALRESYGVSRVVDPIPQAVVVEQAPASGGLTLFEYAPDSPVTRAYWKLAERTHND